MITKIFSLGRATAMALVLFVILLPTGKCDAQVTVSISSTAGILAPGGNATLTTTVTGATGPFKYFYSGTNTSGLYEADSVNPYTVIGPGIYSVRVTDKNYIAVGTAKDTIYSTVVPSGSMSILDSTYNCSGNWGNGSAVLNYTGFFVPVNITFSPWGPYPLGHVGTNAEPVQDTFGGFGPGTYLLTITDALEQTLTDSIHMGVSSIADFNSYITASPDTIEPGQNTTITVHFQGGIPPYSASIHQPNDTTVLIWNTIDTVYNYATPSIGIWTDVAAVDIGTANRPRCSVYGGQVRVYGSCVAGQCVWPGDADWNGVVNNFDLLPIGIGYDSTGYGRSDTSITWSGHYAQNWNDSLQDSINYRYIDCNGNGVINADDTLAIIQNYSLTYVRGGGFEGPRSGNAALYPKVMRDTVYNGDTLTIQLVLGNPDFSVNRVYGLAFTLNYDKTVVDTSKTSTDFSNSWLGTNTQKISIARDLKQSGQLQCALTRINHRTKSGQGVIGIASFVITTDNLNGKDYSYYNALFYISNLKMVDSVGNPLSLDAGIDSALIGYFPTGIHQTGEISDLVHVFPNPASNTLMISCSGLNIRQISIRDVADKEVISNICSPLANITEQRFDIAALSPGIYLVEVITDKGVAMQKLIISR